MKRKDLHKSSLRQYTPFVEQREELKSHDLELIRAEVNALLLPLFFLSKKGERKEIEYRAVVEVDGIKTELVWKVFPSVLGSLGIFEKEVFRAVEYLIVTRCPFPVENPIPFSIYDLCRVMGLAVGGKTYKDIKTALLKIAGTLVVSQKAFYHKGRRSWIDDAFHLYDRVVFEGDSLPDGGVAETNLLWLGRWYLESLNAFYLRPLDYKFYRSLRSPVARRLYELLGVKFYGALERGNPYVHYRYSNLCALLPVTRQPYLSWAQKKLLPAHEELLSASFLAAVEWFPTAEKDDWVVRYFPGPRAEREIEEVKHRKEWTPERVEEHAAQKAEDDAWIRGFASYLAQELADERSYPFYEKLARQALRDGRLEDLIYRTLSEVKDDYRRGRVKKSKAALFTDRLKRYCQDRGITML